MSFGPAGLWEPGARGICFSPPGLCGSSLGEGSVRRLGVLKEKAAYGLGEYVFPSDRIRVAQASLSTLAVPKAEQKANSRPYTFPQRPTSH